MATERIKSRTQRRTLNPPGKATKTVSTIKTFIKEKETFIGVGQKVCSLIQKYFDREILGFVTGIGRHESKKE